MLNREEYVSPEENSHVQVLRPRLCDGEIIVFQLRIRALSVLQLSNEDNLMETSRRVSVSLLKSRVRTLGT